MLVGQGRLKKYFVTDQGGIPSKIRFETISKSDMASTASQSRKKALIYKIYVLKVIEIQKNYWKSVKIDISI